MVEEKKDQGQEAQSEEKPVKNIKESLARFDKKQAEVKEAGGEGETKPEGEKAVSTKFEEECPECPKGKSKREELAVEDINWDKVEIDGKWPKPLQVKGKVVWAKDSKHAVELMQKGQDYTQDKQTLSQERQIAQDEFDQRIADINKKLETVKSQISSSSEAKKEQPPEPTEQEVEAKLYERYGIDKEFAEPKDVEMIKDLMTSEKRSKTLESSFKNVKMKQDVLAMKMAADETQKAMKEAIKQYPIEEVVDEKGNNQSFNQFRTLFVAKLKDPDNENVPIPKLGFETIREIHLMQQKGKEAPASTLDVAKLKPEELKKLNPDLYKSIAEAAGDKAVAKHEEEESEQPPSLQTGAKEVETKPGEKSGKPRNVKEGLDKFDFSRITQQTGE